MLELKGRIVLPDRVLDCGRILCDGERILEITELPRESENPEVYILPGLIDIHNHGALCHDYMEASEEAFGKIAEHLTAHGITTAQCTTVSAPVEQIQEFLAFFREWQKKIRTGADSPVFISKAPTLHRRPGAHIRWTRCGLRKMDMTGSWIMRTSSAKSPWHRSCQEWKT